MKRREFLRVMTVAAGVPLAASGVVDGSDTDAATEPTGPERPGKAVEKIRGDMRYRPLGQTGEEVSVIGLGGHHIGRQKDEKESIRIIRAAIDAGINFMDNCWDYHDGGG